MKKEQKPFLPYVSKEQIAAFDKDRPETFTASPLVNAVLEAFDVLGLHRRRGFADYFALQPVVLSYGLKIATGMTLVELRNFVIDYRLHRMREEHPDWDDNRLAKELGYADRGSIWQQEHAEERNDRRRKLIASFRKQRSR